MKHPGPRGVFPQHPTTGGALGALPIGVTPIVAHQGGWDEILMVVAPLALIGGLLWLANRRVTAQLENEPPTNGNGGEGATVIDGGTDNTDVGRRGSGDDGQD